MALVPDLLYQISSKKMLLWEGKKTVLLSSGCLTSFLVRCMCPLHPLRLNDLTVAETELFRHPSWRSCHLSPYAQSIAPQCGRFVHSVRNVPCKLLSTEVASRSPSSLIHHKRVFRCISIYDARLDHPILLDRGVEAEGSPFFRVHLSSTPCRCRAVLQVTYPSSCRTPFTGFRKCVKCCKTEVAMLFLGKELENVEPLVYVLPDGKELETVGSLVLHFLDICWSSATSVVSWLVTMLYFKFFAALNLLPRIRPSFPF